MKRTLAETPDAGYRNPHIAFKVLMAARLPSKQRGGVRSPEDAPFEPRLSAGVVIGTSPRQAGSDSPAVHQNNTRNAQRGAPCGLLMLAFAQGNRPWLAGRQKTGTFSKES